MGADSMASARALRSKTIARALVVPSSRAKMYMVETEYNRAATGDEDFMRTALELAVRAEQAGEVPVGAVVVMGGHIVGRGANSPIALSDPTAHAEIIALREAARAIGNYRLAGAALYVTVEPCVMCAGATVAARIERLVFGARDLRFGAVRSKFRLTDSDLLNHQVEVVEGVLAEECLARLQSFFRRLRDAPDPESGR
ncbi:MAG TPA: tRNA adenosine(34) deaminase TadA [Bryobacterales bacterium]|nr:tRNA adenosine(34) deaminase TadA [Bryobacterales bacterium]